MLVLDTLCITSTKPGYEGKCFSDMPMLFMNVGHPLTTASDLLTEL